MPRTSAQDLQEEFLTTIRKGQENVLDALKTWVETVRTVTPKLPIVNLPFADKLPNVAAPFADRLPSPREAVGNTYCLAEQLLDNQRKFAEDVLKLTEPLIPGHGRSVRVTQTAPKPAAPAPAPPRRGQPSCPPRPRPPRRRTYPPPPRQRSRPRRSPRSLRPSPSPR